MGLLNIIAICLAIIQPNQTKGRCLNTNQTFVQQQQQQQKTLSSNIRTKRLILDM